MNKIVDLVVPYIGNSAMEIPSPFSGKIVKVGDHIKIDAKVGKGSVIGQIKISDAVAND